MSKILGKLLRDPKNVISSVPEPDQSHLDDPRSHFERVLFQPNQCICHRSKNIIFCTVCGTDANLPVGRVATMCPAHPTTMYIADFTACPKCLSPKEYLVEVRKKAAAEGKK